MTGTTVSVSTDFISQYVPTSQTLLTSTGLTGFTPNDSEFWKITSTGDNLAATMNDDYHKLGVLTGSGELTFTDATTGWVELRNVTSDTIATLDFTGNEAEWDDFAAILELGYDGLTVDTSTPLSLKLSDFENALSSAIFWDLTGYNFAVNGASLMTPETGVPEPGTWMLLLLGMSCLFFWRRKCDEKHA